MKFFKENSYEIVRLYINNIGITIFSLMLYFSAGHIAKESVAPFNVVISIFSIGFLMALVYCAGWDLGAKDRVSIDAGRMDYDKHKGVKIALFANVPNFVLAFFTFIFLVLNMITSVEGFKVASAIFDAIMRLTMSMYIGVINEIFNLFSLDTTVSFLLESLSFLLMPALVIFATAIGYRFGEKNIRIFDLLRQKKGDNE